MRIHLFQAAKDVEKQLLAKKPLRLRIQRFHTVIMKNMLSWMEMKRQKVKVTVRESMRMKQELRQKLKRRQRKKLKKVTSKH